MPSENTVPAEFKYRYVFRYRNRKFYIPSEGYTSLLALSRRISDGERLRVFDSTDGDKDITIAVLGDIISKVSRQQDFRDRPRGFITEAAEVQLLGVIKDLLS